MLIHHPNTSPALCNAHSTASPSQGRAACPLPPSSPPLSCHPLPHPCCNRPIPPNTYTSCSLILPSSNEAEKKERRRQQRREEGKRTRWVISAGHRLDMYTRNETGLKIQGGRPQKPCDGLAQWKSVMSY